ncbi:MAG: hypothetical protein ACYCOR_08235 [Acidobacteriaceae bacterium]
MARTVRIIRPTVLVLGLRLCLTIVALLIPFRTVPPLLLQPTFLLLVLPLLFAQLFLDRVLVGI